MHLGLGLKNVTLQLQLELGDLNLYLKVETPRSIGNVLTVFQISKHFMSHMLFAKYP